MSTNDKDHLLVIDNAIRTLDEVSSEMKKLIVKTELLLCDLLLNFSHPVQADASRENEEKSQEEFKHKNSSSFVV